MTLGATFAESIALIGLTALLTGLFAPYVLKEVDYRKTIQQKLIDAQAKFLDDITGLLWRWRYLAMKVAYYGGEGIEDRYAAAWREYDESIWQVMNAMRTEVSRSRHLVSEARYWKLRGIYEDDMVRLDRELGDAHRSVDRLEALSELNRQIYHEVTDRIDDTLAQVAAELGLSGASPGTATRRERRTG
jgi:hypothetical protein